MAADGRIDDEYWGEKTKIYGLVSMNFAQNYTTQISQIPKIKLIYIIQPK